MFLQYVLSAFRGIHRSPGLSALIIVSIAFGMSTAMTTFAVYRAVSADPIPWKSSRLFVPQIDFWGSGSRKAGELPEGLDYADAVSLLRDHRGVAQSVMYQIVPWVRTSTGDLIPRQAVGHAVSAEFFRMLDIPFLFGNGWGFSEDQRRDRVVVISNRLNRYLFRGANSVGKSLTINGRGYRVVGVIGDWNPSLRFYDLFNAPGYSSIKDDIFVPFFSAIADDFDHIGSTACAGNYPRPGVNELIRSDCAWIAYMVELEDAEAASGFRNYLDAYVGLQQASGRFAWAASHRLRNLREWLDHRRVVPKESKLSLLISIGLLLACMASASGLLLSQFLRRAPEISIRRTLGAPRIAIYAQFLTESSVLGFLGGLLGVVLIMFGIACLPVVLPQEVASLVHLDMSLLALTLLVAMIATALAAAYPVFLVTRTKSTLRPDQL